MSSLGKLRLFCAPTPFFSLSTPISLLSLHNYSSSSSNIETESGHTLTQEELAEINLLVPRLCASNHLPEAIRLIDATLLANPSLNSLSLPILIDRLSAEPDLTQTMYLLNRLKHSPQAHPSILPISKMLLSSYSKKGKPKDAFKVYSWMSRPDSPCAPDSVAYAVVVNLFCRNAMVLEALKVVRRMVGSSLVPETELRMTVYRGLLREARVREAQDFNEALVSIGDGGESVKKVLELLDQIIVNWVE